MNKETVAEIGNKFGRGANECRRCGRKQGLVRKYGIYLCRQCFREIAPDMGFNKYS
ncbi:MAG TPA: 30S ribosomal protein S14 [Methanosarcinales archaeon]|jgi:small subunit ribosomal protein S14|nr:30S ribosomal protein S14 type Z [ANME-2 cluster archaeon]HIH86911.1 30S ribosomal protein S14 [Methanosarcinales archaeon]